MEVTSLSERLRDVDRVAGWVWGQWRDGSGLPLEQIRAQLLGEPGCPATLLALEAGEAVGALGFLRFDHPRLGTRLLFINSLYVVPAARRRGIAGGLLAHALVHATASDDALYVYTGIPAWYEARGFTVVERAAASPNAVLYRALAPASG